MTEDTRGTVSLTGDRSRAAIQEFLSGGVGSPDKTDPFLVQSKVLWDKGWGRELRIETLDAYRQSLEAEGLPVKPERPAGMPEHLNRLVLWDRRPLLVKGDGKECVSLAKACQLFYVAYNGDDDTLVQQEGAPAIGVPVRWIWRQDGRGNRGLKPSDCRKSFKLPEVGLEALGGLFLYAQDATVIGGKGTGVAWRAVLCPGSVLRDDPSSCACLELGGGRPELSWSRGGAFPRYGYASRWE